MTGLAWRQEITDHAHVTSELLHGVEPSRAPLVTIAIPTFNRPALLAETVRSALAQQGFNDFDVIVIDNRSEPANTAASLEAVRATGAANIRYYLNSENTGLFGNWNRCLLLATGTWVSILNDDDLLDPTFLAEMVGIARDAAGARSFICQKRSLDQRGGRTHGPVWGRIRAPLKALKWGALDRLHDLSRFGTRRTVRLTPRRLFWNNLAGNSLGSLYHRQDALAIGGYHVAEYPTADYFFHARLAMRGGLAQVRDRLCTVRILENVSMRLEVQRDSILLNSRLRMGLVEDGEVPPSWRRYVPLLAAYECEKARHSWHQALDRAELERMLGYALPERVPAGATQALRTLLTGY